MLFTNEKFVFPIEIGETIFCKSTAIEISTGKIIEQWIYKQSTEEERMSKRSLAGLDSLAHKIINEKITREDYNCLMSKSKGRPDIMVYTRNYRILFNFRHMHS